MAGVLKPVFAKQLIKLLPESAILQRRFPFSDEARLGDSYQVPLLLKNPQGVTLAGSAGDVVTLNSPLNSKTENAKILSFETVWRDQASYGFLDRAMEQGQGSFVKAITFLGQNLASQARNLNEAALLWGQMGIATVSGLASQVITVTDDSFAPGILALLEGAVIDVYQADLSTSRQLGLVVTGVDLDAKTITVTGVTTGIVNTDVVFIKGGCAGSGNFNEMVGLWKQCSATTGSIFGIAKQTYSAYRGSVMTSVGPLTAGKLLTGAAKAVARGFQGKLIAIMSPKSYAVLNANSMAQRMFDGSYSTAKATNGTDALEYKSNGVTVEPLAHPMMHEGKVLVVPEEYVKRGGAKDVSFAIPGTSDQFLLPVQGSNAVELQCSLDQFIFAERPSWTVAMSGITYAG